jgi:hypothetical protein
MFVTTVERSVMDAHSATHRVDIALHRSSSLNSPSPKLHNVTIFCPFCAGSQWKEVRKRADSVILASGRARTALGCGNPSTAKARRKAWVFSLVFGSGSL